MSDPENASIATSQLKTRNWVLLGGSGVIALIPFVGFVMWGLFLPVVIMTAIWSFRLIRLNERRSAVIVMILAVLLVPYAFVAPIVSTAVVSKILETVQGDSNSERPKLTKIEKPSEQFEATKGYLNQLTSCMAEKQKAVESLGKPPEGGFTEPDDYAKLSQISNTVADQIRRIPTLNVDEDVVQYGLQFADFAAKWSSLFGDHGRYIQVVREHERNATSGEAMLEAFLRGALANDPVGKYNEVQSGTERLRRIGQILSDRKTSLESEGENLESMGAKIRATLTQRYGIQF
jgi:hypothetical protein